MENLTVSIIQTNLFWENKAENLFLFDKKLSEIEPNTDLIILPEMFNTSFSMNSKQMAEKMDGKTMQMMAEWAKQKNSVVTGSLIIEEDHKYYNRLIWMYPDGTYKHYDKRHLFRMANEHQHYAAGSNKLIAELKGWRICPLICYDLRFPVWSRNMNDYDCLIYVANWPERRNHPWKSLLTARAIENIAYVIGVNRIGLDGNGMSYSGDSAVIDFKGESISKTLAHEESLETVVLSYSALKEFREQFPAWMDADCFELKD
jgi:omega-amidase